MKASRFNIVVGENGDSKVIYNTLSGAIVRVSSELLNALNSNPNSISDVRLLEGLSKTGLLVNDNFDELDDYRNLHEQWKRGKEVLNFNVLLTYDCNFECPYCYQGRGQKGESIHGFKLMDRHMFEATKKFIKNTIDEITPKRIELVLYGGEPFLVTEMGKEIVDEISKHCQERDVGFSLHALSNGSLITKDTVKWLSDYKCRLQIPIDGAKITHDKYRYYKDTKRGSYDDITKVLTLTKGTNIETHIRISLTNETCPTMTALLDDLKSKGLNHVYPNFCYITAFTQACEDFKGKCLSDLQLFKIMPNLWKQAHERGFPIDIRPQVQPLPCSSIADGSFIIDPFGAVYKCWEQVGLKEHMVGELKLDGSMVKTAVYNDIIERNPLNIEQCRGHSYLPACAGGCICKAYWQNGTYHASGCGTEMHLLKDKVNVYLSTVDMTKAEIIESNGLRLEIVEGKQKPQMSHCYVLV